jgi:hypothetical protein
MSLTNGSERGPKGEKYLSLLTSLQRTSVSRIDSPIFRNASWNVAASVSGTTVR